MHPHISLHDRLVPASPRVQRWATIASLVAVAVVRILAGSRLAAVLARALLPVAGVLLFGWDVWALILLYWIESWFVGVTTFLKIGAAEVADPSSGDGAVDPSRRGCLQAVFATGCAMGLLYAGLYVFGMVPLFLGNSGGRLEAPLLFLVAVVALGFQQRREYRRFLDSFEYERVTPISQEREFGRRLGVFWTTILVAGGVGFLLPLPARPLVMILAKAWAEVAEEYDWGPFAGAPE